MATAEAAFFTATVGPDSSGVMTRTATRVFDCALAQIAHAQRLLMRVRIGERERKLLT